MDNVEIFSLSDDNYSNFLSNRVIQDQAIVTFLMPVKAEQLAEELAAAAKGGEIVAMVTNVPQ